MNKTTAAHSHNKDNTSPKQDGKRLQQLLLRRDIWRGESLRRQQQSVIDSGHPALNQELIHKGWPTATTVEICNSAPHLPCVAEWLLLAPALGLSPTSGEEQSSHGLILLVNPPRGLYGPGLLQQGLRLDQLLIVETARKQDFIASVVDGLKSGCCASIVAWEPAPQQALNYSELRKCHLASQAHGGLFFLLRPAASASRSSPASLRLSLQLGAAQLQVEVFKQRGSHKGQQLELALPLHWQAQSEHRQWGREAIDHNAAQRAISRRGATVLQWQAGRRPQQEVG